MKLIKPRLIIILISLIQISSGQNPAVQNIINNVQIDTLTEFVKELTGQVPVTINGIPDTILSRNIYSSGNEKAFQYLKQKLISFGLQTDSQPYSPTGKNIYAVLPGTLHPDKKVIIGAHYDDMPYFPYYINASGADDNASGIAAVIEAARILRQYHFRNTIIFAFWDEEEEGTVGSTAWADAISYNDSIMAYINLDMLGWDSDNDSVAQIRTKSIARSLQLANVSVQCNTLYNINLGGIYVENPGAPSSDHASFWNRNYTAISISESHLDFNPYYHSPADSLGQFNLPYYLKVTKLALATLSSIAYNDSLLEAILPESNTAFDVNIFPNPTFGKIEIRMNNLQHEAYYLEINDILGVNVFSSTIHGSSISLDLSSLSKGIYFIKVNDKIKSHIEKIVLQ